MRRDYAEQIIESVAKGYTAIAPDFSRTRAIMWPEVAALAAAVPEGSKVLDLGCGNGRLYQEFAARATEKTVDYVGLDVSAGLIAEAQRLHPEAATKFMVGSAVALPFPNESFNEVFSIAVWHHLPSEHVRLTALNEVSRVLKTGGIFVLTSWNLWQPRFWGKHFKAFFKGFAHPDHYEIGDLQIPWADGTKFMRYCHAFTLMQLKDLLQQSGFTVLQAFYSDGKKQVGWWEGRNIVVVAEKSQR